MEFGFDEFYVQKAVELTLDKEKAAEMAENEKQVHIYHNVGKSLSFVYCEFGHWYIVLFQIKL